MAKITVCQFCTERHYKCHSHCEMYIAQREGLGRENAEIRKRKEMEQAVDNLLFSRYVSPTLGKKRRQI